MVFRPTGGWSNDSDNWKLFTAQNPATNQSLLLKFKQGKNVIRLTNMNGRGINANYLAVTSPDVEGNAGDVCKGSTAKIAPFGSGIHSCSLGTLGDAGWDRRRLLKERKGYPVKVELAQKLRGETTMTLKRISGKPLYGDMNSRFKPARPEPPRQQGKVEGENAFSTSSARMERTSVSIVRTDPSSRLPSVSIVRTDPSSRLLHRRLPRLEWNARQCQ